MIKLACRNCGKRLEAPDGTAGRKGRCPGCGEVFAVPEAVLLSGESAGGPAGHDFPGERQPGVCAQPPSAHAIVEAEKFSIKEAIGFGWDAARGSLGFFVGLQITAGLIYLVPEIVSGALERAGLSGLNLGVRLIDFFLAAVVSLGLYYKIPLNFCDGIQSKIADLFLQYRFFFRYVFATFLYALISAGAGLLLIFPGIYLAIRFSFYGYFIVDRNSGIMESLKRSWRVTRGSAWKLFVYSLVVFGLNILGVLALGVGLFATIPISIVAGAFIYRKLLARSEISGGAAAG